MNPQYSHRRHTKGGYARASPRRIHGSRPGIGSPSARKAVKMNVIRIRSVRPGAGTSPRERDRSMRESSEQNVNRGPLADLDDWESAHVPHDERAGARGK